MRAVPLPFVLGCLAAWLGACAFSTSGLLTASKGSGGDGGSGGGTASSSSASSASSGGAGGSCPAGTKLCGTSCLDTTDPNVGCAGASCMPCPSGNASAICDGSGACALACNPGFGDCDGDITNGCETDTTGNLAHCGACNHACPGPAGQATCSGGACGLACPPGFLDCNGIPDDGCEGDLGSVANCGACFHACTNANGTTACFSGTCVPACAGSGADCNGNPDDGCEVALIADPGDVANCGACGLACPPGFNCRNGVCGCAANDAACGAGAPAGTFSCHVQSGPDVCMCNGVMCGFGQRCSSNGLCG